MATLWCVDTLVSGGEQQGSALPRRQGVPTTFLASSSHGI